MHRIRQIRTGQRKPRQRLMRQQRQPWKQRQQQKQHANRQRRKRQQRQRRQRQRQQRKQSRKPSRISRITAPATAVLPTAVPVTAVLPTAVLLPTAAPVLPASVRACKLCTSVCRKSVCIRRHQPDQWSRLFRFCIICNGKLWRKPSPYRSISVYGRYSGKSGFHPAR